MDMSGNISHITCKGAQKPWYKERRSLFLQELDTYLLLMTMAYTTLWDLIFGVGYEILLNGIEYWDYGWLSLDYGPVDLDSIA